MGFADWSRTSPLVLLDPIGAGVNIKQQEEGVLHVAFEERAAARRITLDLSQSLRWVSKDGLSWMSREPILVAVELPEVPTSKLPTRDAWRNVHFGVGVSSDDFSR